jgi:hypothetical protein
MHGYLELICLFDLLTSDGKNESIWYKLSLDNHPHMMHTLVMDSTSVETVAWKNL